MPAVSDRWARTFPVFLRPETREEYALAHADLDPAADRRGLGPPWRPAATIEDDLRHRGFTINAIALDEDGTLVDPVGGAADIRDQVNRHVGPTFAKDPVRLLRAARFAARLSDFSVATETTELFSAMVRRGDVDALQAERVRMELQKALGEGATRRFLEALREWGALARVFPEIDALFGVSQPAEHHPEIDADVHKIMVLNQATALSSDPAVRFAALVRDLGKGSTPPCEWVKFFSRYAPKRSVTH